MVAAAAAEILADSALLDAWLGPVRDALAAATASLPAAAADASAKAPLATLRRRATALAKRAPELLGQMDSEALAEAVARAMFAGAANGRIERMAALAGQEPDTAALAESAAAPPFVRAPLPAGEADAWLRAKAIVPTALSSRDISLTWSEELRQQSFFSARVASANIAASLRDSALRVASGELSYNEARTLLTQFLAREGYGVPAPGAKADHDLAELASTARLNLVLRQNVAMAQALEQRAVSEDPALVQRWPNYRYVANTERHARFDGLVLPKADPFWATHFPPWDFGCGCMAIDEDAPANGRSHGVERSPDGGDRGRLSFRGRGLDIEPADSGFVFRSSHDDALAAFDTRIVADPDLRAIVDRDMAARGLPVLTAAGTPPGSEDDAKPAAKNKPRSRRRVTIKQASEKLRALGYTLGAPAPWEPGQTETVYEIHNESTGDTQHKTAREIIAMD